MIQIDHTAHRTKGGVHVRRTITPIAPTNTAVPKSSTPISPTTTTSTTQPGPNPRIN